MSGSVPLGEGLLNQPGLQLGELLEELGEAIVIRDRDDRFAYANRAALRSMRLTAMDELVGLSLQAIMDRYLIQDEFGRPLERDAIPSVAQLEQGAAPEPLLVHTTERVTGVTSWLMLKSSGLRNREGAVVAAMTMIEDVTPTRTAEAHMRVLAESGRYLAASLDYQQTLRNVAQAALPGLADWCLVELIEDGVREEVVVAHIDPDQRALANQLRALEPAVPAPQSAVTRVMISGESEFYSDVDDAHLRRVAVSPEQLEVLRALQLRSAIVVPMVVPSRIIGTMSFFTSVSRRRLTQVDVALAEQLGRRAAVAVENSRLHTTLSEVANTLQQSLLPSPLPEVAGWEIASLYQPALADQRVEVGGDFYEVFETDGAFFAVLGDITGHGVAAATMTSLLRHGARFASHLEPDPMAIVRRLDDELRRRSQPTLCSALVAALGDHSATLCSAGHPPAMLVTAAGQVSEAPDPGPLLGAFSDSRWNQQRLTVDPGDLLLLYTDGVTEARGAHDRYTSERLRTFLADHAGSAPQAMLDALDAELTMFRGDQPGDDVAALALRARR